MPLAASSFGGGSQRTNMRYNDRGHLNPTKQTVYRAVDNVELTSIHNLKKFTPQQNGIESKYFANSLSNAHKYGSFLYPNGYTIVRGSASTTSSRLYWSPHTDGIGAYVYPPGSFPSVR